MRRKSKKSELENDVNASVATENKGNADDDDTSSETNSSPRKRAPEDTSDGEPDSKKRKTPRGSTHEDSYYEKSEDADYENGSDVSTEIKKDPKKKKSSKKGSKTKEDKSDSDGTESETNESEDSEKLKENKIKNGEENNVKSKKENKTPKRKRGRLLKSPKKAKQVEQSSDADDSVEYEVEAILDERTVKGRKQYWIKWKNYDESQNTWEAVDTLNCPDLIKKFNKERKNEKSTPKKYSKEKQKNKTGEKSKRKAEEVDWDENADYEVDRIIEVHHKRNGKKEFLVSWKGYPASQNSWVDEEDMDCKDLIKKFMEKVEKAKGAAQKELRVNRKVTDRFTLATNDSGRRLSRRNVGKQRVRYDDAE